jgi:YD repeat-containing protein
MTSSCRRRVPVVLRRTYLSGDRRSRHFGVGGTHSGDWWLYGDGDSRVSWAELILPTTRIRFVRVSEGTSHRDAVLEHQGTPTEFHGARLSWNGTGWALRLRDGASAQFLDCPRKRDVCAILERTDARGRRIEFVRNESSLLLRMQSEGRSISFDYDEERRIVRAFDSSGRQVSYSYDDRGRLTRASGWDGAIRTYEYNDRDELVAVRDPARMSGTSSMRLAAS